MRALLLQLQEASVILFLVSSMLATGLTLTPRIILTPLRNGQLVLCALVLNFLLAPALAWALSRLLALEPSHAAGLLLLGGSAGAPFLPNLLRVARANQTLGAALMVLLTLVTILFLPFALPLFIPDLRADPWEIARPLLLLIMAPLAAGMFINTRVGSFAARISPILAKIGSVSLSLLFVLLVGMNASAVLGFIGSGAILAALLYFLGLFALGSLSRGRNTGEGAVFGLATTARNFGAALVPAASGFSDPDVTVMIILGAVVCLVVSFAAARWSRGRIAPNPA